jgi:hypothetical protein
MLFVNELLSRYFSKGLENGRIADPAGLDLPLDHALAKICKFGHRPLVLTN